MGGVYSRFTRKRKKSENGFSERFECLGDPGTPLNALFYEHFRTSADLKTRISAENQSNGLFSMV